MNKWFVLVIICALSSCTLYQPDIQQGNIMTPEMTKSLKIGMTKAQVEQIMGNPALEDTFSKDRINYVYTFKSKKNHKMTKKRAVLTFKNDRLVHIEKH